MHTRKKTSGIGQNVQEYPNSTATSLNTVAICTVPEVLQLYILVPIPSFWTGITYSRLLTPTNSVATVMI